MSFDLPVVHNPSNTVLQARLQTLIDNKTKPLASLGRLEAPAVQIGGALGTASPVPAAALQTGFAGVRALARGGCVRCGWVARPATWAPGHSREIRSGWSPRRR